QIRKQAEFLAQPQQRGAFGTFFFWNRRVAVGQTDGAEQNGVGLFADVERDVRQRLFGEVNARPADGRIGDVEFELESFFRGAQNLDGLAHDFRPDAVARERCDVVSFHEFERTVYFFCARRQWNFANTLNPLAPNVSGRFNSESMRAQTKRIFYVLLAGAFLITGLAAYLFFKFARPGRRLAENCFHRPGQVGRFCLSDWATASPQDLAHAKGIHILTGW